jgi:hypothetical protein
MEEKIEFGSCIFPTRLPTWPTLDPHVVGNCPTYIPFWMSCSIKNDFYTI